MKDNTQQPLPSSGRKVVEVSRTHPRYYEDASGKTWVPIGCNICFDRLYDGGAHSHGEVRAIFDRWLRTFAANGGNCIRLWAGHSSLEVMPDAPGAYDAEREESLRRIISLCEELGIKAKITLESFRTVNPPGWEGPGRYSAFFNRPLYARFAKNMREFIASEECYGIYMGKARHLKEMGLGDSPAVYCWEPWNEINCIAPISGYAAWGDRALADLKAMFPRQMTVLNLGSFSDKGAYQMYDQLAMAEGNDFMQIHRYLDPGADLDVCRGPMDVVAASAVRELLERRPDRPAIVAETGAVRRDHAGPSVFYGQDTEGSLLHDELFAPFFSGSAGSGQPWHWDHQYIDGNGLWWHFRRFAAAIDGLDPVAERFRPFYTESRRLRMYGLKGRKTAVIWCRDKRNSWEDEFVRGEMPETIAGEEVPFRNCEMACYLPFEDKHVAQEAPVLPPFRRSIVLRVPADATEGVVRPH